MASKPAMAGGVEMVHSRTRRIAERVLQAGALAVLATMALWWLQPAPEVAAEDPLLRRTPTVRAVEKAGPAVVNITTERIVQSPFRRPTVRDPIFQRYFDQFLPPQRSRTAESLGSGVLIDREGHILTNEHVIERASAIRVSLADGREFEATLVGADPTNDIAVLRVDTDEALPSIALGRSDDLLVGEPVIAIGNPHGLSNTVTTGVISAIDRSLGVGEERLHGLIQTDASINPGNSGGPLLNAEGTLIGINTAIYWRSDQPSQSIGFAIPIDSARRVIDELIDFGEVQPVWLGLEFQDLDPSLHQVLRLPSHVSGVIVNGVAPESPSASAGIARGDIVAKMDSRTLRGAQDLYESLRSVRTGQRVELGIWRDGRLIELAVRAEELPDTQVPAMTAALLGMELDAEAQAGFRVRSVRRGSAAHRIGFQPGDVLLSLGGRPLEGEAALKYAVADLRWRSRVQIVVLRGAGRYHVTLPLRAG
jgi:serine protease Do